MCWEPGSGHREAAGCWGYRRAAKFPGSEAVVDAEAGIQVEFPRVRAKASSHARDAKGSRQSLQGCRTPGAAAAAGMASRPDKQHRGSSARDDIVAAGCRHRMNPWPGPSRGGCARRLKRTV